jgi:hypothetical protein
VWCALCGAAGGSAAGRASRYIRLTGTVHAHSHCNLHSSHGAAHSRCTVWVCIAGERLKSMMLMHGSRGVKSAHNELVLERSALELPTSVAAFFYSSRAAPYQRAAVTDAHRAFLNAYHVGAWARQAAHDNSAHARSAKRTIVTVASVCLASARAWDGALRGFRKAGFTLTRLSFRIWYRHRSCDNASGEFRRGEGRRR